MANWKKSQGGRPKAQGPIGAHRPHEEGTWVHAKQGSQGWPKELGLRGRPGRAEQRECGLPTVRGEPRWKLRVARESGKARARKEAELLKGTNSVGRRNHAEQERTSEELGVYIGSVWIPISQ